MQKRDDEETPARARSEMRAAPVNDSPVGDTLPSIPSAQPTGPWMGIAREDEEPARSERIMQLEARLERQLLEIQDLTLERFALISIADQRAERANECLQHARDARVLIRKYVDAVNAFAQGAETSPESANKAFASLVAFVVKPL